MKQLNLIDDASSVWHRLWSVRLALVSAALSGADALVGYVTPEHPRVAVAVLAALASAGGALARVIVQRKLREEPDA